MDNAPESLLAHEFIGVRPDQVNLLYRKHWRQLIHKMVILQSVTIKNKEEYELHKVLRAIDLNTVITLLEPHQHCRGDENMVLYEKFLQYYEQYPDIISNTKMILDQCSFDYDFSYPRNKKHYTRDKQNDIKLLTSLAYPGLTARYGDHHIVARERVEKELKVIDQLSFSGYFLITWDIVRYSNSMGFMHIGRGSDANIIIAYCLGITDICPLELDLYFERFLNLNRKTPPDFDLDWSWQDRDVILQYIFDRYGKEYVAFCGTNVEFKYRSILREVGKVLRLAQRRIRCFSGSRFSFSDHYHS